MSSKTSKKRFGLILTTPTNSSTAHTVPGWPGFYRADMPTPVGEPGDALSLQDVKDRIAAAEARIDEAEENWHAHEAEKADQGLRPNGPLPFGDAQEIDGEIVVVRPRPPLELVEIKAKDVELAEAAAAEANAAAVDGLVAHRSEPLTDSEKDQIADDTSALKEVNDSGA